MASKFLKDMAKDFDIVFASLAAFGPIRAAHRNVRELQQEGPSWSGRFSNSWQIETEDGRTFKGDGGPGEPRPLPIPALTGRQALKAVGIQKDRAVFTVSNFSPHVAEATDHIEGVFIRDWADTLEPQTALGRSKWNQQASGRRTPSFRGDPGGGNPLSVSSSTADLDWFDTYIQGGRLDRAVKTEMDTVMSELRFL